MPSLLSNCIRRCASGFVPLLVASMGVAIAGCATTSGGTPAGNVAQVPLTAIAIAAEDGMSTPVDVSDDQVEQDADEALPADTDPATTDIALGAEVQSAPAATDAERDFDALYGAYNPVADSTLPDAAQMPGVYDPWERYNRTMHRFNNAVDRNVARPLAQFYVALAPRPVRLGVSNFFSNLGQPVSAINALLQGKPVQAGHSLGRFVLNTTLGIVGIFDPASDANLDRRSEDFGQTLGVWGWERSRYVELPLFGPRTVRDVLGMVGDAPLSPLRQVEPDKFRVPLQGLQLVDVRTQLLSTDSLREGAADDYALVRDAWTQRRNYQILGDRMTEDTDESLPDYLRDDDNPLVPASAMPVMPTD